jgi:hypothetical protein
VNFAASASIVEKAEVESWEDGLRAAGREKLPAWLEASAKGALFIRSWVFVDVEDIVIDLSKYGGDGVNTTVCMVRRGSV